MTRRRLLPCTKHGDCTRPDGHEGACGDPSGDLERADLDSAGVAAAFSGRVCPSCGWHESGRNDGRADCYVCRASMLGGSYELRQLARVSGGHSSPFDSLEVHVDYAAGTIAVVGRLVVGRSMLFGPLPIRADDV